MGGFRTFLLANRHWTGLLLAAALCLKAIVPAGYMPVSRDLALTLSICGDASGHASARQVSIPLRKDPAGPPAHAKGDCPFGLLKVAGSAGTPPALLATAQAYILALGFAPRREPVRGEAPRLRPPLRGPPRATA